MDRTESKAVVYRVPVRQVVGNTNPRNPLGAALQKLGWTVFGERTDGPSLWLLGTSDDAEQRRKFVEIVQQDEEFVAWSSTFIVQGQLQAVEVRGNGQKKGKDETYTLVFGCRRCLAILYNWCLTGKPAEPVVEARLAKGSNATMLARAVVENRRAQPSVIEEARSIQQSLNMGSTTEDVARDFGYSDATIRNRLALLELEPAVQQKIHDGRLTVAKATAEKHEANGEAPKSKMRSRKVVEEALGEFAETTPVGKCLAWVLGQREELQ